MRFGAFLDGVFHDFRFAFRRLRRSPGFALAVVFSLALGIGANSAIFTIVEAMLLRPLPYVQSDDLVGVGQVLQGSLQYVVAAPYYREWAASSRTVSGMALYNPATAVVNGTAGPERVQGTAASSDLARVLGVQPEIGRFFTAQDQVEGAQPVVVLAHALWKRQFGGDSTIVGRTIEVNEKHVTVVGVLAPESTYPVHTEIWTPWRPLSSATNVVYFVSVIARRNSGIPVSQVEKEFTALARRADPTLPAGSSRLRGSAIVVTPLHDELYGSARLPLIILFGAVSLLLLIACANVANLVLARAVYQRHEMALRKALGAGRFALLRPVLAECVLLSVTAGALGVLASTWMAQVFVSLGPQVIATADKVGTDRRVLFFSACVSVLCALVIGAGPAIGASRDDPHQVLRDAGARAGRGRLAERMRRGLVVGQLAVAMVLLTGAGLLLESMVRLTRVELGFQPDHVLVATLDLPRARYGDDKRAIAFFDELRADLAKLPGTEHVASGIVPLAGAGYSMTLNATAERPALNLWVVTVGGEYFETFRIPIRTGRGFLASDQPTGPPVVVLNQSAARALLPAGGAINRVLDGVLNPERHPVVVGIAGDVRQGTLTEPNVPVMYVPQSQVEGAPRTIAVRTRANLDLAATLVRRAVHDIDPRLPPPAITTMRATVEKASASQRFTSLLLGAFAALALVLATLGLFSVVAYLVAQRTHEIGVRIALGAQRRHVFGAVLLEGMTLSAAGIGGGLLIALALARVLQDLLYGVAPRDPVLFTVTALGLATVAFAASYLPARRATRVDPIVALRHE